MVSTRTQTGTITVQKYDYKTLSTQQLRDVIPSTPKSARVRKFHKTSPRKGRRQGLPARSKSPSSGPFETSHLSTRAFSPIPFTGEPGVHLPEPQAENVSDITGYPPVCFGESETVGLSKIERATQNLERWTQVKKWHEEHAPKLVPIVNLRYNEARQALLDLEDNEENNAVGSNNRAEEEVKKRIVVLEETLQTSEFDPEKENIKAAIAGYQSGGIPFSRKYTIIWAGQVIETFDSYSAFSANRSELLDGYFEKYGQGWLWWEPPLDILPQERIQAQNSAALQREVTPTNMGHFNVNLGFSKRFDWVARLPYVDAVFDKTPAFHENLLPKTPEGLAYCQKAGPRLVYNMLLDSGASYATLYRQDIEVLGIDTCAYAAQSTTTLVTANGETHTRVFEMLVTVVDDGSQELVDVFSPAYPQAPKFLGGLNPVIMIVDSDKPQINSAGVADNGRLSGMLPFTACYMSYAPTRNVLLLGEDRNDVLGAHKMPGQARWDLSTPANTPNDFVDWKHYGSPHLQFLHHGGQISDIDALQSHVSRVTINMGVGIMPSVTTRDPGGRLPLVTI